MTQHQWEGGGGRGSQTPPLPALSDWPKFSSASAAQGFAVWPAYDTVLSWGCVLQLKLRCLSC